ncbi:methylenetetrahydrofolate reductase [Tateyamaria omphalii]|uniref:methylenetetrahydrofolate reductase n=1 Tax=Tateyamaria omphalii TaxID=299262 RepID=UPI00167A6B5B|nr:methylenetetrahydrofolate reductase [Tateyamaria omphalii]GGX55614.1 methylenetetrahydrofolate reductase [Tateyamaria omphalii]
MPTPDVALSFETFPPKSLDASFHLWDTVQALTPLNPRFVSVTYGAGGTTQSLTQEAARTLRKTSGLPVAAHLTCTGQSRDDVLRTAEKYAASGVKDIVALRGDPQGGGAFEPHPDGFAHSVDLIRALSDMGQFTIRVGAYPDSHPDATSAQQNIDWLKAKIDAGASEAITQFFFEADSFLRFRDACVAAGITAPITPGIFPVANWTRARSFAEKCGTPIPVATATAFDRADREDRAQLFALTHCADLCDTLVTEGVDKLHFYTLNRPDLTLKVCRALGLVRPRQMRNVA